jgi:riboflavin kinase/FMN adenylyltransferase
VKIINNLDEFPEQPTPVMLAAGCFDGLHIGHRAVIQVAIDRARACGGESWVFTFDPHPAKVLSPDRSPPLIHTTSQQLRQFQEMGVDGCILQPFTLEFMQQEPTEFFENLCNSIPELAAISVGEDWSFGKNRSGNPDLLSRLCEGRDIYFSAHEAVCWKGERISSTRIREAIKMGWMDDVEAMLGGPPGTIGTVVHGKRIGSRLGYPTANIEPDNDMLPPRGIYAALLRVGHGEHRAAAYIGHRETFHENEPQVLEVHLIDETDIDLYGREVEVKYLEYIRDDRIFEDAEELKRQISDDITAIRRILDRKEREKA